MSDLISRADAIKAIVNFESEVADQVPYAKEVFDIMAKREHEILNAIDAIPSADRPRGKNLEKDYPSLFTCSVCGVSCDDTLTWNCDINYCPNCGAYMVKENE